MLKMQIIAAIYKAVHGVKARYLFEFSKGEEEYSADLKLQDTRVTLASSSNTGKHLNVIVDLGAMTFEFNGLQGAIAFESEDLEKETMQIVKLIIRIPKGVN